ncbi:unnamed protein product [Symbiodinium necroappetens]|uniref:Uncharacterized protein n=1 Tax=Symbiodinium necroappetens TaxID=1628268 RepID=A0A812U1D2_9DINO|nr:unnamed protein product [Symbiodinium necroappetens]
MLPMQRCATQEELGNIEQLCESREDPVLGKVYKVHLAADVLERVHEEAEGKLVQLETAFKKKCTKAIAQGSTPLALQDRAAAAEDEHAEMESDEETAPAPGNKKNNKGRDPEAHMHSKGRKIAGPVQACVPQA